MDLELSNTKGGSSAAATRKYGRDKSQVSWFIHLLTFTKGSSSSKKKKNFLMVPILVRSFSGGDYPAGSPYPGAHARVAKPHTRTSDILQSRPPTESAARLSSRAPTRVAHHNRLSFYLPRTIASVEAAHTMHIRLCRLAI